MLFSSEGWKFQDCHKTVLFKPVGLHSPECFCTSSRTSATFFLQKIISKTTCQAKLYNKLKHGQTVCIPQPPQGPPPARAACVSQRHRREMSSEGRLFLIWTLCLGFIWGVRRGRYCLFQTRYGAGVSVASPSTRNTCETTSLQWCPGDKLFLKAGRWKYPNLACKFRDTALWI